MQTLAVVTFAGAAARNLSADDPADTPVGTTFLALLAFANTAARFEGVVLVGLVAALFVLRGRAARGVGIAVAGAVPPWRSPRSRSRTAPISSRTP